MTLDVQESERQSFLDCAVSIAQNLCASALWSSQGSTQGTNLGNGRECSWRIARRDPADEDSRETSDFEPTDGNLYSGSAGIALFLLRAAERTHNELFLETARGALRHALRLEAELPARGGYYSGTVGIATVCAELAALTDEPTWLATAKELCLKMAGGLEYRRGRDHAGLDLVAGEAGSILGLLQIYRQSPDPRLLDIAKGLADLLMDRRRLEAEGISWDTLHPCVLRNPLGISHGAGGIGLAFLELYRFTGIPCYLDHAVQSVRYEDDQYDADRDSWPDFRHQPLAEYVEKGRWADLKREVAADSFPVQTEPGTMEAWCHGAPGIGLVRAHFLRCLGSEPYRPALERCAEATRRSLEFPERTNHSLCHGLLGNAEILMELARVLEDESLATAALRAAAHGLDDFRQGRPWRCGVPHGDSSPGLMTGEAGIGMFYLRLAAPQLPSQLPSQVPSILLPVSAEPLRQAPASQASPFHFVQTRKCLAQLGAQLDAQLGAQLDAQLDTQLDAGSHGRALENESVTALRGILSRHIDQLDHQGRTGAAKSAREIFELECTALDLTAKRQSPAERFLAAMLRRPAERLEEPDTQVVITRSARLWTAETGWSVEGATVRPGSRFLLFQSESGYEIRPLHGPASLLMTKLQAPLRVQELLDQMLKALDEDLDLTDPALRRQARGKLMSIVRQSYVGGLIDIHEPAELKPSEIDGELCTHCGECCRIKIHIPGDPVYAEFLSALLKEPLLDSYPELSISVESPPALPIAGAVLSPAPGRPQVVLDLGYCRHLRQSTQDGRPRFHCGIYQDRPELCERFNCATWWRSQKSIAAGPTISDSVIRRVAALKQDIGSAKTVDPIEEPVLA